MDIHVRNLGILAMVFGTMSTVGAFCLMAWFSGPQGLFHAANSFGVGLIVVGLTFGHLILGAPLAIVGFFVMRYHNWARAVMIVLCGLSLLNPPLGSLIALYGLWVLMRPETEPLFSDPPRTGRKTPPRVAPSQMNRF